MVGTVSGVRARRFERRMARENAGLASQGPLSSLLGACSVSLCSATQADDARNILLESRNRERQEIIRVEQRAAESEHLRSLINANPLPYGGRRLSRSSDTSEKSVTSDD
jgi:hypothetical protein